MTKEEIIAMAREAGEGTAWKPGTGNEQVAAYLAAFANLIAARAKAQEREACAKVCEDLAAEWGEDRGYWDFAAHNCSDAIRNRGYI